MLSTRYLNNFGVFKRWLCAVSITNRKIRSFSTNKDENIDKLLGEIGSKYKVFKDADSKDILDTYEDKFKYDPLTQHEPEPVDPLFGGLNGVFEIEDLVDVLHRENVIDLFVAAVPSELQYVEYMVIVSGKSRRHMKAIAQFVRRVFKSKRGNSDPVPRIEGAESDEWMALDLGNIALHIFSPEAREKFDLDTLWAIGPTYDTESRKEDPLVEMLEKSSIYLKDLIPAKQK